MSADSGQVFLDRLPDRVIDGRSVRVSAAGSFPPLRNLGAPDRRAAGIVRLHGQVRPRAALGSVVRSSIFVEKVFFELAACFPIPPGDDVADARRSGQNFGSFQVAQMIGCGNQILTSRPCGSPIFEARRSRSRLDALDGLDPVSDRHDAAIPCDKRGALFGVETRMNIDLRGNPPCRMIQYSTDNGFGDA